MSMHIEGDYTILRAITRAQIPLSMKMVSAIDMEKLKVDMAEEVERTSARDFSKRATAGANPDFYRNFMNNGQDKRLSADVFVGITRALGRDPADYIPNYDPAVRLPNATALTSAFALLLETLGIDPFQDERARKLALQFPNALRRASNFHGAQIEADGSSPGEGLPDPGEDRPTA